MTARPIVAALAVALFALTSTPESAAAAKKKASTSSSRTAKPAAPSACTDFYAYANAAWLAANPASPAVSAVSALDQLRLRAYQQQIDLLNGAMSTPQNDVQKLLGDFWASGIDDAAVERDGANPIAPLLSRINAIKKAKDIPPAIAALHQVGIPVAFNFSADVDLADTSRHIGYFTGGGIGLQDPAFYSRTDADTRAVMDRYRTYVQKILLLTGSTQASIPQELGYVMDIETRIAAAERPLSMQRDPRANYAAVPTANLAKTYTRLQLGDFLKAQGVTDDQVSMANPELFTTLDNLIAGVPVEEWKTFLRWRVGDAMAPYLSKSWRDASFDFRNHVLAGQVLPPPRQQDVLDAINLAAGPMLGREYVARYLPATSRTQATQIATQIRDALSAMVDRDPRLGDAAKAEAKAKLAGLKIEVGAPRRDLDYSVQPMGRGSFGSNMLIASTWRHREEMRRIGRGNADRRWDVLPQQPALTYDVPQNRLIVTAAMLQAPVFDTAQPGAALYGAYGALVGHELSHAIDAQGRLIDSKGQGRDWWTPTEAAAWSALGDRISSQAGTLAYPQLTGVKINGTLVRDQLVADQAGVELAQAALQAAQPGAPKETMQAFYTGWAHLWPEQVSVDEATARAATSAYPPGRWRVNLPLMNQPTFGTAFACKVGNPMQPKPDQQVRLWP
ncbi:M13 family peptidase [Lysobacter sp. TY2-98]|uniref:M13-type metalloendopeptidase n=1 Tax=Lysobacter sp. TY2-98 TaxID=2290922 RepID=UPI000E20838D|nr:M13 family metallopeptidase [Lysobacter sp. TY2-98]AXK71535.1 M13 family peptidase [Lysobacter sp. TY2-98]